MRERKNTILLFSKVPEPGLVKTRLSTLKDGVFTPEQASHLYHCMLFDVAEIICAALDQLQLESDVLYSYWQEDDDSAFDDDLFADLDDVEMVEGFDDYAISIFDPGDSFTREYVVSPAQVPDDGKSSFQANVTTAAGYAYRSGQFVNVVPSIADCDIVFEEALHGLGSHAHTDGHV